MINNYYGDFHTHTRYSDGAGSVDNNVSAAVERGLKAVGVTDHGFNNPRILSMRYGSFLKQRKEIEAARLKYPNIEILQGIEADLIGLDGTIDLTDEQIADTDILIAGFHRWAMAKSFRDFRKLYFNANTYMPCYYKKPTGRKLTQNTDAVINMLERYPVDILPHINNFLVTDEVEVAKACSALGVYLELNVKHLDLFANNFEKVLETEVMFIANTDSHSSRTVGDFKAVDIFLAQHHVPLERVVNIGGVRPRFRKERLKKAQY